MLSHIPAHLFLPPFLLFIKKYTYTLGTMFDTRDAKKRIKTYKSLLLKNSVNEEQFNANG